MRRRRERRKRMEGPDGWTGFLCAKLPAGTNGKQEAHGTRPGTPRTESEGLEESCQHNTDGSMPHTHRQNDRAIAASFNAGHTHARTHACMHTHTRRIHMNPDSIRIESSFVQSSSRLIRIESESRSHEQTSSCNNGAFSTLHVYYFNRQKKTHQSLIFAAVSGSFPASSPAISGAQTLSELRGIAAKWNINRFAHTLFDLLALYTRRSAQVSLSVQLDPAITLPSKSTDFTA